MAKPEKPAKKGKKTKSKKSAADLQDAMNQIESQMELDPRISQVKEDVVYLRNPKKEWKFHSVLQLTAKDG